MDPQTVELLLSEGAVPLRDLLPLVPAEQGKRRRVATVVGWITRGKCGVKLEGFSGAGKGWYSSKPALARFLAELTRRRSGGGEEPERPSPSVVERSRRDVERMLAALR